MTEPTPRAPFPTFRRRAPACSAGLAALLFAAPTTAAAQRFATPPGDHAVAASRPVVATEHGGYSSYSSYSSYSHTSDASRDGIDGIDGGVHDTVARLAVGPAGLLSRDGTEAGLAVAADFGRGAAGFRVQAAWLGVGRERGVAQYTAELTVEGRLARRLRPHLGVGGGVARTSSSAGADGSLDADRGATLGVGVVRAGVALLLPLDADARVGLDVSAAIPAIRGDRAPDVGVYGVGALTVSLGF